MSDLSKPLYTLTIEEYKELQQEIFQEQFQRFQNPEKQPPSEKKERDIIFMDEVCEITGYSKPTMYSKISRYEIPVLSRGKPLTFSKKEIIEWIHQGKPNIMDRKAEEYLRNKR
ncbi:helix-turn-helix domain-containing protein [Aquimarina muelleri]|uniref:helix-turn-helix domain-containing protein n=1 Tax=Aquimarina muelleri TaxID=279356 RepID=UPI003F688567